MTSQAPALNTEARIVGIIKTEPALLMTLLQTVLAIVASLGFTLTAHQTGAVLGLGAAVLAAIPAILARPVKASAFSGLITAGVTVLAAFNVHGTWGPDIVTLVNGVLTAAMGTALRMHLTPLAHSPAAPSAEPAKM